MLRSIWEDAKREYNYGNMVSRIIIVNVMVFVVVNIVRLFFVVFTGWEGELIAYNDFLHFFCMSSSLWHNVTHIWVVITNMFLHEDFWHILWNMLFLYWFGRVVGDMIGNHRILPLYLLGGMVGAFAFYVSANVLGYAPTTVYALGASGAVMAIAVASATIAPNYLFNLIFIGEVKLKYIVGVLVFLDLIAIGHNYNTGGHFAHLGGAFMGWFFVSRLQQGDDWSQPINNMLRSIINFFTASEGSKPKRRAPRPKVVYKDTKRAQQAKGDGSPRGGASINSSHQEQLDAILDKI